MHRLFHSRVRDSAGLCARSSNAKRLLLRRPFVVLREIVGLFQFLPNPRIELVRELGKVNGGFQRLNLTEKQFPLALGRCQYSRSVRVVFVTPSYPPKRHLLTALRISLMNLFSRCRSFFHSVPRTNCSFPLFFFEGLNPFRGSEQAPSHPFSNDIHLLTY